MVVGEFTQETNLVVIGGGPAGYTAAFRAARLGIETVLVDMQPQLGGLCLHSGCIPSKTLLHLTESIPAARRVAAAGIEFAPPQIDLAKLQAWSTDAIAKLAKGLASQAKQLGVEVISGRARFEDAKHIAIQDGSIPRLKFRRAIIATGARPVAHPQLSFDHELVWTPARAVALPRVPARLLVIGTDYIAVELASIYTRLGSNVTLAGAGQPLLPDADPDLVRPLQRELKASLDTIDLDADVQSSQPGETNVHVMFTNGKAAQDGAFDAVIVSPSRIANTANLNLLSCKVECADAGSVIVNEQMQTSNPRIWAAGDVTGSPMLADRALTQGRIAAEAIAGHPVAYDARAVPSAVFTDPQVAWCGVTEREAKAEGLPHAVAKIPWGRSGRAVAMGRPEGVSKIVYDPESNIVLGVGMTGINAAELIAEGAIAVEMGAQLEDLANTIHPHPTVVEMLSDAARDALEQQSD